MSNVNFHAVGRRKKAIARVRLIPGEGNIIINKRSLDDYFGYETLKTVVRQPLVLTDTLQTDFGCDSVVSLTLTFTGNVDIADVVTSAEVNVYPNPTSSIVHVAADDLYHVELYDNEGRRLQDYDAQGKPLVTLDIERFASGVYYLRVHTKNGVTIQKVIKR